MLNEGARQLRLGCEWQFSAASAIYQQQAIFIRAETAFRGADEIGGDQVDVFGNKFGARRRFQVVRLCGEPNCEGRGFKRGHARQNIWVTYQV